MQRGELSDLDDDQLAARLVGLRGEVEHAERTEDVARAVELRMTAEDLFTELVRRQAL
jgi:hypothetical protein